jgi:hypothetical protein
VNFITFQSWREQHLRSNPLLLDCAETNLYRTLSSLRPNVEPSSTDYSVHRCDLARAWLTRCGFSEESSRRALVCGGVRHALTLIFKVLARRPVTLWVPADVYPVYAEVARAAGIEPQVFVTLPEPKIPVTEATGDTEYLLITNPWQPLGRFLTDQECAAMIDWLQASTHRHVLVDCVYDFGAPLHSTTQRLQKTGRAILLHSVTKSWLWPKTFGIAFIGDAHSHFEQAFRDDSPPPPQLRLAQVLLSKFASCPAQIVISLENRVKEFFAALPDAVSKSFLTDRVHRSLGCYLFPVSMNSDELLREHHLLAIPARAFGAGDWDGSILTSLSAQFAPNNGKRVDT